MANIAMTTWLAHLTRLAYVPLVLFAATAAAAGGQGASARLDYQAGALDGTDEAAAHRAIDALSRTRRSESVRRLTAFLRSGQRDALTDHALRALGVIASPEVIEVLVEFTGHRRADARKEAYLALAAIDDPRVPALLANGLRDGDARVRSASALALGEIDGGQALEELFVAFELGVAEAAVAIGRLVDDDGAERFGSFLGKKNLAVMLWGYEQLLNRDDIAERTKLAAVAALGELASQVFSETAAESDHEGSPAGGVTTKRKSLEKPRGEKRTPGRQIERFLGHFLASSGAKGQKKLERFLRATILRIRRSEAGD